MANAGVLRESLLKFEEPVFAVLDGAQFDDLPSELFNGDFAHQSLYKNDGVDNRDRVRTTPQLVWLDRKRVSTTKQDEIEAPTQPDDKPDPTILDRLIALIGERPAAVFWACPQGGDALYRHLRTINMVLFPRYAASDLGESYEANSLSASDNDEGKPLETRDHDLVLFRHADANVIAQVLPALDASQFARLFGPASTILFVPDRDWGGGAKQAIKPDDLPKPPSGPLKLNTETVQRIESHRLFASRRHRMDYVRDTCRAETAGASDEMVAEHIRISDETGKQLGLVSEAAHCRWAFIMCKTNGRVLKTPEILRRISSEGSSPDEQVRTFMVDMASALKASGHRGSL